MSVTSVVNFENYSVKDFLFQRNGNFPNEHVEIEFDFKAEAAINEEKTQATILLECTVFNEEMFASGECPFYLNISMEGLFSCGPDVEIDSFEINGIAILLPYLRATITSFTAQAGIAPLIIPPINVYNLVGEKGKED